MSDQRRLPTHQLKARLRVQKGEKAPPAIKLASAWPNDFGGHNVSLESKPWTTRDGKTMPVVQYVQLSDGTRITPESHWLDWTDIAKEKARWAERDAAAAGKIADDVATGSTGDGDDIPF